MQQHNLIAIDPNERLPELTLEENDTRSISECVTFKTKYGNLCTGFCEKFKYKDYVIFIDNDGDGIYPINEIICWYESVSGKKNNQS